MSKVIGIDLGTTNSVVAIWENGQVTVIPNSEGKRTTPSIVAFKADGDILVGEQAKRQAVINSQNTIYSIKRFMGKRYSEVSENDRRAPYKVVESSENRLAVVDINGKHYTPQEISAFVLRKLKKAAEDYLGTTIKDAVITVPAYFNDSQRKATKEAGEIAGLNVLRIINEPTAAALAYGLDKKNKNEKIVVFDLGGGTFDISILEIGEGVFEVLATSGDSHLGGDDFDQRIIDWLVQEVLTEEGIDLRKDSRAMQRIREAAENAKIELSNQQVTEINLPYITVEPKKGPINIQKTLTRTKFESLCSDLYDRCKTPCYEALKAAGIKTSDIDEVILVGGSTRMPRIQQLVEEIFGKKPNKSVNPDEAVAIGAAIQGSVLAGETKDILLLDVIPLSLGIETLGGVMTKIIEANTTIPTRRSEIFSTAADNQPAVEIHVLQGERAAAADNRTLGRFILDGIPPAPRGVPQIEVTFDVDANGILTVSAKNKTTGKEQSIRIEAGTGLSKEEIERMKKESEQYAEQDKIFREKAEKLNKADTLCYQAEKLIAENKDKIDNEIAEKISNKVNETKIAVQNKDYNKIETLYNELSGLLGIAASQLYNQEQAQETAFSSAN
jgi:molecular chaperone DnaK